MVVAGGKKPGGSGGAIVAEVIGDGRADALWVSSFKLFSVSGRRNGAVAGQASVVVNSELG